MTFSLEKLPNFAGRPGPLLLIIMDGIGIGRSDDSNAVHCANTPVTGPSQRTAVENKTQNTWLFGRSAFRKRYGKQ